MQDREQIQKEIDAVRLQISIVDTAATTAPDDEKERWSKKRITLQTRLEALQKDLAACKGTDSGVPVFDDAEADAMFNQIIFAEEGKPVSEQMSDAVFEAQPAPAEISDTEADEILNTILFADGGTDAVKVDEPQAVTDAETDAIFEQIFSTPDSVTSDLSEAQNVIMADEPPAEQIEPENKSEESVFVMPPAEQEIQAPNFSVEETDSVIAMMPQENEKEEEAEQPQPLKSDTLFEPLENAKEESVFAPEIKETEKEEKATEPDDELWEPSAVKSENEIERKAEPAQELIFEDGVAARSVFEQPVATEKADVVKECEDVRAPFVQPAPLEIDAQTSLTIEKLKAEAEEANRKAQLALAEAEKLREEAEKIKLAAETERAMYSAEMELRRGIRQREEAMREEAARAEKDRINEKIARRKAEITEIRNGLQDVKDSDSAFALREKLFAVQLVLDEDERNSSEISYLLTKSLDDLSHVLEVSELKRRLAALAAAKKAAPKAAPKKAAPKKKAAKKPAKKKRIVAASRRRPPLRPYARRRPPSRYSAPRR